MRHILTSLVALSATGLLAACQDQQPVNTTPIRPILTVVVKPHVAEAERFAGTIEPRYTSDRAFQVLGRIISRDANVADIVKTGQQLFSLDPVANQLALRSAQADLASATAQLANAAATEIRQRTLRQKDITSEADFDAARQARELAEAGVVRAKANLAKAEEQLGYSAIRADFDGVVTAVDAELGQVVQPGQTVVSIARPDVREAVVDLPQTIAQDLKLGARFDVSLQLDPSVRASGHVREIASQADPATRTLRVRITLDGPPESFRLGTTITATVIRQTSPDIEMPASALLERDSKTMVWVVDPAAGTVSTKNVSVAARDASTIRISDHLPPGTRVATAGVHSLIQGQTVKIAAESPQ